MIWKKISMSVGLLAIAIGVTRGILLVDKFGIPEVFSYFSFLGYISMIFLGLGLFAGGMGK